MKKEHKIILNYLSEYLENGAELRFGQALFNLGINEFKEIKQERDYIPELRNTYNDIDSQIIKRIENRLEWFNLQRIVNKNIVKIPNSKSLTTKEKLIKANLLDYFNKYKKENKDYAEYILRELKVNEDDINEALNE